MRIALECYAVYCAILSTLLTGALAFNVPDNWIDWVARKIINTSALVFGPVLFTLCLYGLYNIRALASVCNLHGIVPHAFNGVCVFLLMIVLVVSIAVCYCLTVQKTLDMAEAAFTDDRSCLYQISQLYFRYQQRLKEQRRRYRQRERDERRADRDEAEE